jgi:hypothetical protein
MAERLSIRDNYMRLITGEIPDYIPGMDGFMSGFGCSALFTFPEPGVTEFKDMFGVPYKIDPASGPIPEPNKFILTDVTKWRDIIKRPKVLDEIDWELTSQRDLEKFDPANLRYGMASVGNGYFMMLTYFMGFDNALVACMEEPDEVKDLLSFICDMNNELAKNFIYWYKPDIMGMGDDIAHERAPFVSEEMFLDIFEPMWRREVAVWKEADLPAEHHNCGAFAPFVPYIVDMGFNGWNPAQPTHNDLPAIKAKYGRKLALVGCFESNGWVTWPQTTEEEIRAEVRRVCDLLAPDGGFAFAGFVMGLPDDPVCNERNGWIRDEFENIRYNYY